MQGTIKRLLPDKRFGFIHPMAGGPDLFFHESSLQRSVVSWDELREGDLVDYTESSGPKGPRAENVKLAT